MLVHEESAKIVTKPWGRELWFVYEAAPYAFKMLEVKAGYRLSLQYHRVKQESAYCLSGQGRLYLENRATGAMEGHDLRPGFFYSVQPLQRHRLEAVTDLRIIEVSTPQLDDVVRVEDDTQRPDGPIAHEHT